MQQGIVKLQQVQQWDTKLASWITELNNFVSIIMCLFTQLQSTGHFKWEIFDHHSTVQINTQRQPLLRVEDLACNTAL